MLYSYILLVASYLKWAWSFLLHFSFFSSHRHHHLHFPEIIMEEELISPAVSYHEDNNNSNNEKTVECAVCLCKIEHREEIRELRCNHVFHRVCLESWIGYKNLTCPLCRGLLAPRRAVTELGIEVLVFNYCSCRSNTDRDTWWLR